jgi:hypothetical protein
MQTSSAQSVTPKTQIESAAFATMTVVVEVVLNFLLSTAVAKY